MLDKESQFSHENYSDCMYVGAGGSRPGDIELARGLTSERYLG